jgi:hypothetical protein
MGTGPGEHPLHWDLLSDKDKTDYMALKKSFCEDSFRRVRGRRIEAFDTMLEAVRQFAEQGNESDWKRFLVCGMCWMDEAIAVNIRQARKLLDRCKSSINGSLQKMGYLPTAARSEVWQYLFSRIPCLKDNFPEVRQWTVRCRAPNGVTDAVNGKMTTEETQVKTEDLGGPIAVIERRAFMEHCPLKLRGKQFLMEETNQNM